jgi:hypothetical protein
LKARCDTIYALRLRHTRMVTVPLESMLLIRTDASEQVSSLSPNIADNSALPDHKASALFDKGRRSQDFLKIAGRVRVKLLRVLESPLHTPTFAKKGQEASHAMYRIALLFWSSA